MGIQERRDRERAARRTAVLDAARSLVREQGFNGTTTKKIAERCELSEATLFWYFKNKDEIFVSLLYEGIDFMGRGVDEAFAKGGPPETILARLWKFFGQVYDEHSEYLHVFTYLAHPQATAAVTDEVRDELARRSGDNFRRFAALLQEHLGIADGRLMADVLWATFSGLSVLQDSRANLGAKVHPTQREMRQAFQLLLNGVASTLPEDTAA